MTTTTTTTDKHPKLAELESKLSTLEQSLLSQDPQMPNHLKEIHKYLIQFEELSHLLTEEQIAIILDAQQRRVGVILAAETKSKKNGGGKGLKNVTADDL
jgi:hypothetical protein